MTPKKLRKKTLSAQEHDAEFKAGMKRIRTILKRVDEREKKMAPMMQELRKFVDE